MHWESLNFQAARDGTVIGIAVLSIFCRHRRTRALFFYFILFLFFPFVHFLRDSRCMGLFFFFFSEPLYEHVWLIRISHETLASLELNDARYSVMWYAFDFFSRSLFYPSLLKRDQRKWSISTARRDHIFLECVYNVHVDGIWRKEKPNKLMKFIRL